MMALNPSDQNKRKYTRKKDYDCKGLLAITPRSPNVMCFRCKEYHLLLRCNSCFSFKLTTEYYYRKDASRLLSCIECMKKKEDKRIAADKKAIIPNPNRRKTIYLTKETPINITKEEATNYTLAIRDLDESITIIKPPKGTPKTRRNRGNRVKKEKVEVEDTSCVTHTYDSDGNYVELDPITFEVIKKD
jgi:hypothetical protein